MQDFLDELNNKQLEAVTHIAGPNLVLAGAGTGKTKVLTARIAYLISTNSAFANQIVGVTFTNKAAKEIMERTQKNIDTNLFFPWLGTFHSISAKILRSNAAEVGLQNNFTIIDSADQIQIIKNICKEQNIDEKIFPAKNIAYLISLWKDKAWLANNVQQIRNQIDLKAREIYPIYQEKLLELNACDFGDLIMHVITLLQNNPDILRSYHQNFKYILVDEYQDTSVAQYLWLRLLAQGHNNIFAVGDDDQSIYGWRGAEVENILRFEKDFPGAHIIKLEENYRSTNHILAAASNVISANSQRHKKSLFTQLKNGKKVKVIATFDDYSEAKNIAEEIESLQSKKTNLNDIAILVRASFQTRILEEIFINYAIPYRIIGGLKFYERKEIKDLVAYMRLISNHNDNLAFERIINTPRRGVGPSTILNIISKARSEQISYLAAAEKLCQENSFKGKVQNEITKLLSLINKWKADLNSEEFYETAKNLYQESGYAEMLKKDNSIESDARIENIKEFLQALRQFSSLEEFLEHIALVSEKEEENYNAEYVNIMTLHSAKGLEFKNVFLSGWEEGIFPHQRSIDEMTNNAIEEERRLAYVGITRARENLYITYATNRRLFNRRQYNQPSRFLANLPKADIEFLNQGGRNFYNNYQQTKTYQTKEKTNHNKYDITESDKVSHQKFGDGIVVKIVGDLVEVNFAQNGKRFTMLKALTKI